MICVEGQAIWGSTTPCPALKRALLRALVHAAQSADAQRAGGNVAPDPCNARCNPAACSQRLTRLRQDLEPVVGRRRGARAGSGPWAGALGPLGVGPLPRVFLERRGERHRGPHDQHQGTRFTQTAEIRWHQDGGRSQQHPQPLARGNDRCWPCLVGVRRGPSYPGCGIGDRKGCVSMRRLFSSRTPWLARFKLQEVIGLSILQSHCTRRCQ